MDQLTEFLISEHGLPGKRCRSCGLLGFPEDFLRSKRGRMSNHCRECLQRNDFKRRVISALKKRVYFNLKAKGIRKTLSSLYHLGCTKDQLVRHLISKLRPGMTMQNYGEWEIDHIIPISQGETEDQVLRLNFFLNLQPLWGEENRRKGDKLYATAVCENPTKSGEV